MNYEIRGSKEIAEELKNGYLWYNEKLFEALDHFTYDIIPVDQDTMKVVIRFTDKLLGASELCAIFAGRELLCYGSLGTFVFEDAENDMSLSGLPYDRPWLIESRIVSSGKLSPEQRRGKLWFYIKNSPWYGRLSEERKNRLTDFLRGGEEKVLPGDVLFEEKAAVELIAKLMHRAEDEFEWQIYFQSEMKTREQFLFGTMFEEKDEIDFERHTAINQLYRDCLNYGNELYIVLYLLSAAAASEAEKQ